MPSCRPVGGGAPESRRRGNLLLVAHFKPSECDEYSVATLAVNTAEPRVGGPHFQNLVAELKLDCCLVFFLCSLKQVCRIRLLKTSLTHLGNRQGRVSRNKPQPHIRSCDTKGDWISTPLTRKRGASERVRRTDTVFHRSGDKLHIKLASAAIDCSAAAGMDAVHIREIQLYSYNQLQFLTGVLVAGGRREG